MISPNKVTTTRIFLVPLFKAILTLIMLCMASALMIGGVAQAAYPDKPLHLIIPAGVGGSLALGEVFWTEVEHLRII